MATQDDREAPIPRDILEAIFSHVPLIHLLPARHVSNSWRHAVSTSLQNVNPVKPWLTVHAQSHRAPHVTNTFAYDPRSRSWLEIHAPHPNHTAALRSSHSTLLYTLSPSEFTFSIDPLHLHWTHAPAPRVWRTDPVVASVGSRIVVAGGSYDFEEDPLAVEMYDTESRTWIRCQSMPEFLKDSTASTWLSVAVGGEKMHVTEKSSGVTYSLECKTMTWQGPYNLRTDHSLLLCNTGTIGSRLMVIGIVGDADKVKGGKLWEVKGELESRYWFEELGEMPMEMVEKLMGDENRSIEVIWVGDYVYLHNLMEPEDIFVCEVHFNGGGCKWTRVTNVVVDATRMRRIVFCGGHVGVQDLQRALADNCTFLEKN